MPRRPRRHKAPTGPASLHELWGGTSSIACCQRWHSCGFWCPHSRYGLQQLLLVDFVFAGRWLPQLASSVELVLRHPCEVCGDFCVGSSRAFWKQLSSPVLSRTGCEGPVGSLPQKVPCSLPLPWYSPPLCEYKNKLANSSLGARGGRAKMPPPNTSLPVFNPPKN